MTVPQPPAPTPQPNPFAQTAPEPTTASRRLPVIVLTLLLAATLVALGVVTAQLLGLPPRAGDGTGPDAPQKTAQPVTVTNDAVAVGAASASTTVDLYVDYICPYCGTFDRMNGPDLAASVADGTVVLRVHPMSFLDQASQGTNYSTRAANAAVTVARLDPGNFLAFHMGLFEFQPMENTPGLTDEQLVALAKSVGVPDQVSATFASGTNNAWVATATQADFAAGVTGTPTVMINGKKLDGNLYQPGALKQALGAR